MESRGTFLKKETEGNVNLYPGSIYENISNTGYINIYPNLSTIFNMDLKDENKRRHYYDKDIMEVTSSPEFIVSNETMPIIFISGLFSDRVNSLQLHIVENFIVNWKKDLGKAILKGCPGDYDSVTYSTLTEGEIFKWSVDKIDIEEERLFSDVQFIFLDEHPATENKGQTDKNLIDFIETRNSRGLITILLYEGSLKGYVRNNYEMAIIKQRRIIRATVPLTEEEAAFSTQHQRPIIVKEELDNIFKSEVKEEQKEKIKEDEYSTKNIHTKFSDCME